MSRVVEASPGEPFLGLVIEFNVAVLCEVMEGLDAPRKANGDVGRGVFVANFDGPLADCALRMVRLLDTPKAIPVLYSGTIREISEFLLVATSPPWGAQRPDIGCSSLGHPVSAPD